MASIDRLRGGRRGGDRRDGHNRPDDMNHADRSRDHDGRSRPGGSHHAYECKCGKVPRDIVATAGHAGRG